MELNKPWVDEDGVRRETRQDARDRLLGEIKARMEEEAESRKWIFEQAMTEKDTDRMWNIVAATAEAAFFLKILYVRIQ